MNKMQIYATEYSMIPQNEMWYDTMPNDVTQYMLNKGTMLQYNTNLYDGIIQ